MIACKICTANGHQAIKLPSGRHICPMKVEHFFKVVKELVREPQRTAGHTRICACIGCRTNRAVNALREVAGTL